MVWSCLIVSFSTGRFQAAFICSASHDSEYLAPCSAGHFELSSVGTSSSELRAQNLLAKIQISKSYPKQIFSAHLVNYIFLPIYTEFDVNPLAALGLFFKEVKPIYPKAKDMARCADAFGWRPFGFSSSGAKLPGSCQWLSFLSILGSRMALVSLFHVF